MMDPLTTKAGLHQMPVHMGDGWSWGGDWILSIGEQAFNLGPGDNGRQIGQRIVSLWNGGETDNG